MQNIEPIKDIPAFTEESISNFKDREDGWYRQFNKTNKKKNLRSKQKGNFK